MVRAEIVLGVLAILATLLIYALNRRQKGREERDKKDRLKAIRRHLADAAYSIWRNITSAYGVNRDMGSEVNPGVIYIDRSEIDLSAWNDHAAQYQQLADPVEYRFARQLFDRLRNVVDAPLPDGLQRGTQPSFIHLGDWVEGCQTMVIPMTEIEAIGAGTLFEKIADYLDLVDDGRTIALDYFPRIWMPHPYNPRWAIPHNWKELYATGYYQRHNEPDGRAKPIPHARSIFAKT